MFWYLKSQTCFSLLSRHWELGWPRSSEWDHLAGPGLRYAGQASLQTADCILTSCLLSSHLHILQVVSSLLAGSVTLSVNVYNYDDGGLFWCKEGQKMSIITWGPVSTGEDSRYVLVCYNGAWELRADRAELCPNKRLDRRQEHPQASHPAPPLCLHITGSTKMRQQL